MLMRQALKPNSRRQQVVRQATVPAPVGGWDAESPLASMPKENATRLENWFPRPGYVEIRRGHRYHSWDLGDGSAPVESLLVWQGKSSSKLFGAAGDTIYDVTSRGQATSAVTSLTDAYWQSVNFTNAGADFLYIVNGADAPRHYNGTTWATPTITGITPSDVVHVNVHKKRLWFTLINSTKAAYLDVDAIAGAATTFELGSNFDRGGYLMAMATWTRDGGPMITRCSYQVAVKWPFMPAQTRILPLRGRLWGCSILPRQSVGAAFKDTGMICWSSQLRAFMRFPQSLPSIRHHSSGWPLLNA